MLFSHQRLQMSCSSVLVLKQKNIPFWLTLYSHFFKHQYFLMPSLTWRRPHDSSRHRPRGTCIRSSTDRASTCAQLSELSTDRIPLLLWQRMTTFLLLTLARPLRYFIRPTSDDRDWSYLCTTCPSTPTTLTTPADVQSLTKHAVQLSTGDYFSHKSAVCCIFLQFLHYITHHNYIMCIVQNVVLLLRPL